MAEIGGTLQEIAGHLNDELGLSGPAEITRDIVRRWIGWGLLRHASASGRMVGEPPEWRRSDEDFSRARRLAQLHSTGIDGERQLLCQCWFEGWDLDFRRVRPAIRRQFAVGLKQLLRTFTTNFDPRSSPPPSPAKTRAIVRQAGPPSEVSKKSEFNLSPADLVTAISAAHFGQEAHSDLLSIFAEKVSLIEHAEISKAQASIVAPFLGGLNGIFGRPDEITDSAITTLQIADETEFRTARELLAALKELCDAFSDSRVIDRMKEDKSSIGNELLNFTAIGPVIFSGSGEVVLFTLSLHALHLYDPEKSWFLAIIQNLRRDTKLIRDRLGASE
jgi:hypothetical protein